jgi:UDP-N-acetylmuramoyl-L-alanyl-D-glutamate--2,6-diaminopimelate ligase
VKLSELLAPEQAPAGADGVEITGLTLDSRRVARGFLFAALPGVRVHGRAFIKDAVEAGAAAILTDHPVEGLDIPVLLAGDAPAELARLAARFHPGQPEHVVAVTGTNGKSSTVEFLRQIWDAEGLNAACLGTLGVTRSSGVEATGYTTPDAVALHRALDALAQEGVTHLGMEASSHGLKQRRMEAVTLSAAGFSNLTQDHLDYHPDFADYFVSKARLFTERLAPGKPAVINTDSEWGGKIAEMSRERGLEVMTVGWRGEDLCVTEVTPRAASQDIAFTWRGQERRLSLPLVGEFQTQNAVLAAGLAIAGGMDPDKAFAALEHLTGVPGRLEKAGETRAGAPVLVDYAHTPDGLDKLLRAARPHTRGRVILVFGAGGDRDPSKRAKMGVIAAREADIAIVTDDNPRSEDPAAIRAQVMEGCPEAREIGDRSQAIRTAVDMLGEGDVLLIAGKGHETGQTMGGRTTPFDDREEARRWLAAREDQVWEGEHV